MNSTPTAESTQTASPISEGRDGMILIYIPAGYFYRGEEDADSLKKPHKTVFEDAFWIDKTEVTNRMYLHCVEDHACSPPLADGFTAPKDFYKQPENAELPVNYVSWNNANEYCKWAGRRLPFESEWEKAARGTDDRIYPWGNVPPTETLVNFGNRFGNLSPVGSFPAGDSPYGASDMLGNVWEYVNSESDNVILKGGGYFDEPPQLTISAQTETYPEYNRSADFGFRCAADE